MAILKTLTRLLKDLRNRILNYYTRLSFFWVTRILIFDIFRWILNRNSKIIYSQTGECMIIETYLGNIKNGFYIDVGCNQPMHLSNTFRLYLKGWQGINIDANSVLIEKFKRIRLKDTCICAAVSDEEKEIDFYMSDVEAVSTMDPATYQEWKKLWKFNKVEKVKTKKLNTILKENLEKDKKIDLLTIDVEGLDFNVLKSIDLNVYRPTLIVIEIHNLDIENIAENIVCKYLKENEYKFAGYVIMNAYFIEDRSLKY